MGAIKQVAKCEVNSLINTQQGAYLAGDDIVYEWQRQRIAEEEEAARLARYPEQEIIFDDDDPCYAETPSDDPPVYSEYASDLIYYLCLEEDKGLQTFEQLTEMVCNVLRAMEELRIKKKFDKFLGRPLQISALPVELMSEYLYGWYFPDEKACASALRYMKAHQYLSSPRLQDRVMEFIDSPGYRTDMRRMLMTNTWVGRNRTAALKVSKEEFDTQNLPKRPGELTCRMLEKLDWVDTDLGEMSGALYKTMMHRMPMELWGNISTGGQHMRVCPVCGAGLSRYLLGTYYGTGQQSAFMDILERKWEDIEDEFPDMREEVFVPALVEVSKSQDIREALYPYFYSFKEMPDR